MLIRKLISRPVFEASNDQGSQQPPPGDPWFKGKADDKILGHMQLRFASHLNDPAAVAIAAIKSHMEAEKFIGVPANQLLRLPTDPNDTAAWKVVHQRLGAPADPKEYAFGDGIAEPIADALRTASAEANLTKDAAARMGATVAKLVNDQKAATEAERTAKINEGKEALTKQWGKDFETNKLIARNAATRLGVDPAAVDALEGVLGYDKVMEMFRAVGVKIGEAKFLETGNGGGDGRMTAQMASARKAELMQDKDWVARYLKGGANEKREMMNLNTIIVGS